MNEIIKLTQTDGTPFYACSQAYRYHHQSKNETFTRVNFAFVGNEVDVVHVIETPEEVARLFDSDYAERNKEAEPPLGKPESKFCKLKPDAQWCYQRTMPFGVREHVGSVLEIMNYERQDGRYHVRIVDSPNEGFYVYPREVDYCDPPIV